jgi:coenzyme F420-0:L-glutamate ligase/coenzyme F420-1:gamma-L-glutamate ligase
LAGHDVIIGSRSAERAQASAEEMMAKYPGTKVSGDGLLESSQAAELVAVTVPYESHDATLEQIKPAVQGKIVVDTTVPLMPPKVGTVQLPAAGSAAQEAQAILGDDVMLVSAFQNVAAHHLQSDGPIDCDVLVSGNKVAARDVIVKLAQEAGMRAWHVGPIANSAAAEAMTSLLIQINRKNKAHSGIQISLGSQTEEGTPTELRITALKGVPLVQRDDDLGALIEEALAANNEILRDGDVLVIAQKIVSKAEDRLVKLADVSPSNDAKELAEKTDKDPRLVELILQNSNEIVRVGRNVIVVEQKNGLIMANAGIDQSNVSEDDPEGHALLLPEDSDASAAKIRSALQKNHRANFGVIISDSIGRAWRWGTVGHAIGAAGVTALVDKRGAHDLFGRELQVTDIGNADEIAAAASLLMGQASESQPLVIVRGLNPSDDSGGAKTLLRDKDQDLFR